MEDTGDGSENCERAVTEAAWEERAAHAALQQGIKPLRPSWWEDDEEGYKARMTGWRTASGALVTLRTPPGTGARPMAYMPIRSCLRLANGLRPRSCGKSRCSL